MANPTYTTISDFVLNQIYGYQDANEVKDNVDRLRIAFDDEHTWHATTDTNLGDHADGFCIARYIASGAVTAAKLSPDDVPFSTFFGDGSDGPLTVNSDTTEYFTADGRQFTNVNVNAGYILTLAASGSNTNYQYYMGVSGTLTLDGTISASGQGFPGGTSADDSNPGGDGEPDIDDGFWLHGVGGSTGGAGGNCITNQHTRVSGAGGNRFGQYAPRTTADSSTPEDGDDGLDAIDFEGWWLDPSAFCAGTGGGAVPEAYAGLGGGYGTTFALGGAGGGGIRLHANAIVAGASAAINADGADGNDGNEDYGSTHSGGAGAGSGGDIIVYYNTKTGSISYSVNGGTGGTGSGTAGDGGDGGAARYHEGEV